MSMEIEEGVEGEGSIRWTLENGAGERFVVTMMGGAAPIVRIQFPGALHIADNGGNVRTVHYMPGAVVPPPPPPAA
jgi:hypothetical protein